jgi:hypothetical protein
MQIQTSRTKIWVFLAVALLVLLPLAADPGNFLQPRSSLTVYDSKGKTVGVVQDLMGGAPGPTVALKFGQQIIPIVVTSEYFLGSDVFLLFSTSDCSGTPYLGYWRYSLTSPSHVAYDGTLYVADRSTPPSTISVGSYFLVESPTNPEAQICQSAPGWDRQALEAQPVVNMNQLYQAPFTIK